MLVLMGALSQSTRDPYGSHSHAQGQQCMHAHAAQCTLGTTVRHSPAQHAPPTATLHLQHPRLSTPPLAYQPTQRYEARQQMLNILTGDVEGVDIELELSIRPATRGQTSGQDQGPPLPGHRDGPEQAFRGLKRGERRRSRTPKCGGGGQHT